MKEHKKFQSFIKQLYATVDELEAMFPGRHFTPDGHMVGSIGQYQISLSKLKALNAQVHQTQRIAKTAL